MTIRIALGALLVFGGSVPASADTPRAVPTVMSSSCAGSGSTRVCATVHRRARRTVITRPADRTVVWSAPVAPPAVLLRADGRVLAEEYRPGGMIALGDGPGTLLVVLRDPSGVLARIAVADVARRPTDLPTSVSHRQWSVARFFDRDGSYVADLPDGRRLRVAANGRKSIVAAPDARPAFCRYAEPDPHGPCTRR